MLRERRRRGSLDRIGSLLVPVARVGAIALTLAAVPATGQGPPTFEFSFSNPGARAMGFGGAFAALADDATAAFANPAGLVQLLRPEMSAEIRRWQFATPYNRGGRIKGEPTGIGIDTDPGIHRATSRSRSTDLSFGSFVFPGDSWSVAVFSHKLASFSSLAATQGIFGVGSDIAGSRRFFDTRTRFDLEVDGFGAAVGWRVSERLSVGVGLVRYAANIESESGEFLIDEPTADAFFGINHYLPERELGRTAVTAEGEDVVVNAGFLWLAAPRLTVGGFYRQGPKYPLKGTLVAGPAHPSSPPGTTLVAVEGRIELPDVFGFGAAFRTTDDRLTLSAEWDRVRYSMLTESLRSSPEWNVDQAIDDASEVHVGGEYAFLGGRPVVALRAGAWIDPDHRLRSIRDDALDRFYFQGGSTEIHHALGVGLAFESLQIDIGIDLSDPVDTASLSLIYSF